MQRFIQLVMKWDYTGPLGNPETGLYICFDAKSLPEEQMYVLFGHTYTVAAEPSVQSKSVKRRL